MYMYLFEVKVFILEGEIYICVDGVECVYWFGDIFYLVVNVLYIECYGL